jgi:hypothetical protein
MRLQIYNVASEIWGFKGDEDVDCGLLGQETVKPCKWLPVVLGGTGQRACHWIQGSRVQTQPRAIKICSTPPFGEDVKPSARYRRFYDILKIPAEYNRDSTTVKFKDIYRQIPASLLDVSAANWELWWMNQKWLELRLGHKIDQKMAEVHWTLCTIPSVNSNQYAHVVKKSSTFMEQNAY